MTTHPRGDVKVTIDGKDYVLVPNFKAIAAIHRATDLGLGEIVEALGLRERSKLRVDVVAEVLLQAILANGKTDLTVDDIGEAVVDTIGEDGQPLITAAYQFIVPYFGGKKKHAEEKKPVKAKA